MERKQIRLMSGELDLACNTNAVVQPNRYSANLTVVAVRMYDPSVGGSQLPTTIHGVSG
jgi:hypothetical protein